MIGKPPSQVTKDKFDVLTSLLISLDLKAVLLKLLLPNE